MTAPEKQKGPHAREWVLYRLWMGQVLSALGSSVTGFSISIKVYEMTGSVAMMVALNFVSTAPLFWLGILAGTFVDTKGPRTILLLANGTGLAASFGLFLATGLGQPLVGILIFAAFANSAAGAFIQTALHTLVPSFVPRERLQLVNGRVSAAQSIPHLLGPAAGALLLSVAPLQIVFLFNAATFAAALAITAMFRHTPPAQTGEQEPFARRVTQGARWIKAHPPFAWLTLFFALGTGFNGMASGLVAAYILMRTGNDETALAITNVMLMLGVMLGGLLSAPAARLFGPLTAIGIGSAFSALGRMGLGLGGSPMVWGCSQLGRGTGAILAASASNRLFQEAAPERIRGSVLGTQRAFSGGLFPIAIILGGIIGSAASAEGYAGLAACFVVFGVLELATLVLLARVKMTPESLRPLPAEAE
jgi:MFS transporter, DHA3 family, macrolide efflux protein